MIGVSVAVTAAWYEMTAFTFSDAIAVNRNEIILTPRHTESVTKVHLANLGPCYTRFASLLNVQSRAESPAEKFSFLSIIYRPMCRTSNERPSCWSKAQWILHSAVVIH